MIEFRKATVTEHGPWIDMLGDVSWRIVLKVDNNTGMFHYRIDGKVYKRLSAEFEDAFKKAKLWEKLSNEPAN